MNKFLVERLVASNGLHKRYIHHLVVANAHHHVALPLHDSLDGSHTRTTGQNAVVSRRTAATLQVSENRHTHIKLGELMAHTVGIIECSTLGTLGDDNDARLLRLADATLHETRQLVYVGRLFRNDGSLGTTGNGRVLGKKACVAPHHLDKENALVALGRVANAVYAVGNRVQRGVVANGRVGTIKVVVDGAWQADTADVVLTGKVHSTRKRAVTADDDESVNLVLLHLLVGTCFTFGRHKIFRAGSL